jgi:hypothetical protein
MFESMVIGTHIPPWRVRAAIDAGDLEFSAATEPR